MMRIALLDEISEDVMSDIDAAVMEAVSNGPIDFEDVLAKWFDLIVASTIQCETLDMMQIEIADYLDQLPSYMEHILFAYMKDNNLCMRYKGVVINTPIATLWEQRTLGMGDICMPYRWE